MNSSLIVHKSTTLHVSLEFWCLLADKLFTRASGKARNARIENRAQIITVRYEDPFDTTVGKLFECASAA